MRASSLALSAPLRALAPGSLALLLATSIASADIRTTFGYVTETSPPASVVPGDWEEDDEIRIFLEQRRVLLAADLEVDIVAPGTYGPDSPGNHIIPAGTRVNSYLMHLDQEDDFAWLDRNGGVLFAEPVLGIIISDDRLDASDATLGAPATTYPSPGTVDRGLNLLFPGHEDVVIRGRRRVSVDLAILNVTDQVRIITGFQIAFSPDLGSDTEFADPFANGNEILDQGDLYLSGGSAGAVTFWNDLDFLSMTYPDTAAPVPYGLPAGTCGPPGASNIFHQSFDLDGFDEVAVDLTQYALRPLFEENVEGDDREGIFGAELLMISYDDDSDPSWFACGAANVPTESSSPAGQTYGQTAAQDEVIVLELAGSFYPLSVSASYGIRDEVTLHPDLGPNPIAGSESEDDDVDALDWLTVGRLAYFSSDHEGVGGWYDPVIGMTLLSPGTIYLSGPGVAPNPVIIPGDLGLPADVDLDAFEFCWLEVPGDPLQRRALALVFSVDNDDPWTLFEDESGGLDPTVIYYSFLDGFHAVLVDGLEDDVDAIAARGQQGSSSFGYAFCAGDGSGTACPCNNESAPGSGQGCLNSSGQGAVLAASGSDSVSADDLMFAVSNLPATAPALLFVGRGAPAGGSGLPFGDGLRCAGSGIRRLGVSWSDAAGNASWGPGLAAAGGWASGDQRYFQAWFRDISSVCGSGYNLSNGYAVLFTP